MANKFGRNYYLRVTPNDISGGTGALGVNTSATKGQDIIIQPPFTIEIDVSRGRIGHFNDATIRIYNLSPQTRNRMLKDYTQYDSTRTLTLQAGYGPGPNLPTIFFGQIFECHSVREGVDFITQIVAHAAGSTPNTFYQGNTFFDAGTTTRTVIQALVNNLALQLGLAPGFIGDFPKPLKSPYYPSNTLREEINQLSGNNLFIDNQYIHVFGDKEHIPTPQPLLIDSSMGLLGTPTINFKNVSIPIMFEPNVVPGQTINLQSSTLETAQNPNPYLASYNGIQLVQNVHHAGIISDVVSGDLKTEITVVLGAPI